MSKCIGAEGEYGEHVFIAERPFECQRCWVFDEEPALAALAAVRAIHGKTHWCFNDDEQDNVYEPDTEWWPCPTLEALDLTIPPGQAAP